MKSELRKSLDRMMDRQPACLIGRTVYYRHSLARVRANFRGRGRSSQTLASAIIADRLHIGQQIRALKRLGQI
jgi:hypothetical protein